MLVRLLTLLFFVSLYACFVTPTAKVVDVFNKYRTPITNRSDGLNYRSIQQIGMQNLPTNINTNFLSNSPENECLNQGKYLGAENRFENCELLCNTTGVSFKYLDDKDYILYNNKRLQKGSWCLPTSYNNCNISVSKIVWNENGKSWNCVAKYDLFGGPGNNQILGCNGVLVNTRDNITYRNNIPPYLYLNDLDEKWLDPETNTERYVYECGTVYDSRNNQLIKNNLGNRFQLQENYCAKYLYGSDLAATDFEKGACICKAPLVNMRLDPALPCTSCLQGFDNLPRTYLGADEALAIAVPCIQRTMELNSLERHSNFILCGKSRYDTVRSACMTATVLLASINENPLPLRVA